MNSNKKIVTSLKDVLSMTWQAFSMKVECYYNPLTDRMTSSIGAIGLHIQGLLWNSIGNPILMVYSLCLCVPVAQLVSRNGFDFQGTHNFKSHSKSLHIKWMSDWICHKIWFNILKDRLKLKTPGSYDNAPAVELGKLIYQCQKLKS